MKEEEVNFSRHIGQTVLPSEQHTEYNFEGFGRGKWGGEGGIGISLPSLNRYYHQPSMFLQKVRWVIY